MKLKIFLIPFFCFIIFISCSDQRILWKRIELKDNLFAELIIRNRDYKSIKPAIEIADNGKMKKILESPYLVDLEASKNKDTLFINLCANIYHIYEENMGSLNIKINSYSNPSCNNSILNLYTESLMETDSVNDFSKYLHK